jgi:hypothetical protein
MLRFSRHKKDLASIFVEKWRFPLTEEEKKALSKIDRKSKKLIGEQLMEALK